MSLEDLKVMRKELPETCDIEAFVHGAMCMGYSGKCLLSNYITGRDSNRGTCTQPCRFKYNLYEEREPGDYHKVNEGDRWNVFYEFKGFMYDRTYSRTY